MVKGEHWRTWLSRDDHVWPDGNMDEPMPSGNMGEKQLENGNGLALLAEKFALRIVCVPK